MGAKWALAVLFLLLFVATLSVIEGSVTNSATGTGIDEWPSFRYNPTHIGLNYAQASSNSARLLWNYTTGSSIFSSPAVTSG